MCDMLTSVTIVMNLLMLGIMDKETGGSCLQHPQEAGE